MRAEEHGNISKHDAIERDSICLNGREIVGSVERRRDNGEIERRSEQGARISDRRAELPVFINSGYSRFVVLAAM